MFSQLPDLPVRQALPALRQALETGNGAILAAPPGAGKTTLVPLALLDAKFISDGRIILLEPRRLAARASARQMARLAGEEVGQTIGYRTRLDTRVSAKTRIEVVTEGIFTRMLLDNPELPGIQMVIFDEFHERTLDGDFGLALALDVQAALRPDLRILIMSATLDISRVSGLMHEAPVIESTGRSFPIDTRYRERRPGERIEVAMSDAIGAVLKEETGSILAFLPGQGEIRRTVELLEKQGTQGATIAPLYGDLSPQEQDAAIRPCAAGKRKIVLATSIAETSITIDGVRVVIDSGLQRLPVFEPSTGITRLETVRVSRASADQRAGRAGRTEPGIAMRLWRAEQTAALPAFTPPQILSSDLSSLILDCAAWGVTDPSTLGFIDPPPEPALTEARALLHRLNALDAAGHLTPIGETMRGIGLAVRPAAMVIAAADADMAQGAAELAVLMSEQGLGGNDLDLDERWRRFRGDRSPRATKAKTLAKRIAQSASGSHRKVSSAQYPGAGALLLHGFSDRVAKRRGAAENGQVRYSLANGRGAFIEDHQRLSREDFLVVTDLTGRAASQRILAAAGIEPALIEAELTQQIEESDVITFVTSTRAIRARRVRRLGKLVLEEKPLAKPDPDAVASALASGLGTVGLAALPWSASANQLRERIGWLHGQLGEPWPDVSDSALIACADKWFTPYQPGVTAFSRIDPASLIHGLMALVPHDLQRDLDRLAPTHFKTPAGSNLPIRYDGDEPVLAVRVQELFGLTRHPALAGGKVPLLLELLSPAQRPIQTTRDLPGFWAGSWADVRADMRGRYPRHPWPDDPGSAEATRRVKHPRKR